MKVTTDKIVDTVKGGFFNEVYVAAKEIKEATEHATKDQPVDLGSYACLGSLDYTKDHILTLIMLSLMMDEIEEIKRKVERLTKQMPRARDAR